ncbi:uncharacterized protein DEA37_0014339 [Paragonimus westermani]|uniref:BZIP domain-containing protein n=1 Tax=Paragonimus westermani TaxID=34504 RepID=A0A5J4NVI2_9TREM|nr:uncharacterized protein DEA37_0014339 [Paragonimus westermani]
MRIRTHLSSSQHPKLHIDHMATTLRTEKPTLVHSANISPGTKSRTGIVNNASVAYPSEVLDTGPLARTDLSSSVAAQLAGVVSAAIPNCCAGVVNAGGSGAGCASAIDSSSSGLVLASAIAGILGLPFPANILTNANNQSVVSALNHSNCDISPPGSDLIDSAPKNSLLPVLASNHSRYPHVPHSNNLPHHSAVDTSPPLSRCGRDANLPTSGIHESNTTTFAFSFAPQQTCSDVSSETGSAQSPFTPFHSSSTTNYPGVLNESTQYRVSGNKLSMDATNTGEDFESTYHSGMTASERDRKQREFIPDSKKDDKYWERRRKNNEAAKRSREKRRQNDILMEHRINVLSAQNSKLRQELLELKIQFGLPVEESEQSCNPSLVDEQNPDMDDDMPYPPVPLTSLPTSVQQPSLVCTLNGSARYEEKTATSQPLCDVVAYGTNDTNCGAQFVEHEDSTVRSDSVPPRLSTMYNSEPNLTCDAALHSRRVSLVSPTVAASYDSTTDGSNSSQPKVCLPQLKGLDSADLLALKRIFSTLARSQTANTSDHSTVANSGEALGASVPLKSAAEFPLCNPLDNLSPNIDSSTVAAATVAANTATAAWLFQQAMLLPASPQMTLPDHLNGTGISTTPSQTASVSVPHSPAFAVTQTPTALERTTALLKLAGVNTAVILPTVSRGTESSTGTLFESPLDLSLCLPSSMHSGRADSVSSSGTVSNPTDSRLLDKRYQDRRRRNNEAVRRCRENKRARLLGRVEVTDRLQTENRVLRTELTGLSLEVKALRKLLSSGQQESQLHSPTDTVSERDMDSNSIPVLSGPHPLNAPEPPCSHSFSVLTVDNSENQCDIQDDQRCIKPEAVLGQHSHCDDIHKEEEYMVADDAGNCALSDERTEEQSQQQRTQAAGGENLNTSHNSTENGYESEERSPKAIGVDSGEEPSSKRSQLYHARLSHIPRGRRRVTKTTLLHTLPSSCSPPPPAPSDKSIHHSSNGDWLDYQTVTGQAVQTCD